METVKNSRSAFRELRQAAGYTVVQVATLLGVPEGTVWEWNGGGRPRWRYMPGLAQLFQKDLA
jgi:transcriptional regulator with XRE-family HTH domain